MIIHDPKSNFTNEMHFDFGVKLAAYPNVKWDVMLLLALRALGSVKHLETIVLLWRYINKIELNCYQ